MGYNFFAECYFAYFSDDVSAYFTQFGRVVEVHQPIVSDVYYPLLLGDMVAMITEIGINHVRLFSLTVNSYN